MTASSTTIYYISQTLMKNISTGKLVLHVSKLKIQYSTLNNK